MLTFTRTAQAITETTGQAVPTVTTITGEGIVMSGNPSEFAALGLSVEHNPVIGFTPTDYPRKAFTPEFVLPGDTTVLNGITMTVKKILKVTALDGYVAYSRIAIGV